MKVKQLLRKYNDIPVQAKLAIWLTFCNLVQRGMSLLTVPIFTRLMDKSQYGEYSSYLSWLSIATIICTFRLTGGVYNKGLSKYKEDQDGFCLAMQFTTSIITIGCYFLYVVFSHWINRMTEMSFAVTSLLFLEVFFSTSLGFWSVRKQYLFKYKEVVIGTLTYAILNPILGIVFVINAGQEVRGLARIISTVLAQVIVGLVFYIINIVKGKFKFNKSYSQFAIKFNLPLLPHYFSEYILNQSDRIMIQKICTYSEVALYSVAYNAGMVMTILTSSINQAITPWIYQSLDDKKIDEIGNVLVSLAIVLLIPILVFIAMAPEVILILAGQQYAEAVYVIPPVAGSIVFLFLYNSFANIEFYYDYNKFTMYISMIGAVINIILNGIFIKLFGFVAAGYTTFFCYFIYCAGHYLFADKIVQKKQGVHIIDPRKLCIVFIILLFVMVMMSLLYSHTLIRYISILIIVIITVYKREKILTLFSELKNNKKK